MGGRSSTSTENNTTTVTNDTTLASEDNRSTDSGNIGGNITLSDSNNATITMSDYGAIEAGQSVSLAALDFGADTAETSLNVALEAMMGAGNLAEQSLTQSLKSVNDNAKFYSQQTGQQMDRALAFATQSERSESGETMGLIVKVGGVVAALVVVAVLFKGGN